MGKAREPDGGARVGAGGCWRGWEAASATDWLWDSGQPEQASEAQICWICEKEITISTSRVLCED